MYLCNYVPMYLCIYVSMYLSDSSIHPSIRPSVHLSDPSIHPSIDLSIHLSIHPRYIPRSPEGNSYGPHLVRWVGIQPPSGCSHWLRHLRPQKDGFFVGIWMGWILGIYRRLLGIHIGDILWGFMGFFDGIFIGGIIDILWGSIGVFDGNFYHNPELWSYFFSTESSTVSHTFSDNSYALKPF